MYSSADCLSDLTNRGRLPHSSIQKNSSVSYVRPLAAGQAVPWTDLGKIPVGHSVNFTAVVYNTTEEDQVLSVSFPDCCYDIVSPAAGPGVVGTVLASSSVDVTISFKPQNEGRFRGVLLFSFGSNLEAGRLAVSAAVVSGGRASKLATVGQPINRLSKPANCLTEHESKMHTQTKSHSLHNGHLQGEKRMRCTAGLATPRQHGQASTALGTPCAQPKKKARDEFQQPALAVRPLRVPDPATPRHVITQVPDEPPGSIDCSASKPPAIPRLQLGSLNTSQPAISSSRFVRELAAVQSGGATSSRVNGSPTLNSARHAPPKTFTRFHTSLWMDKQETAFKAWLNTLLLPTATEQPDAGRHAIASRRLTAKTRGLLWRIYQRDEEFRDVMLRVEQRVMNGQLKLRDEEACLKNLKDQAKVREVLLSYHPFWLRLGMEVVVNRAAASDSSSVSRADLDTFLKDWFLRDPDLLQAHAPNKAVKGLHPKAYWVQLGQLVLSRVLLMVALFDRAMAATLPAGVPLLFSLKSKVKSSAQVLQCILPGWLCGEGDVLRNLGRLGYKLNFEQLPKREINFAVENLAVDLRDGLRLCKLADILNGTEYVFDKARFPADKRPVKLHNVQLALGELQKAGCSFEGIKAMKGVTNLQPVDVIDGDREMTLSLLWRLILQFQLPQLVNTAAIKMEIERIQGAAPPADAEATGIHTESSSSEHVGLLLQWVQAVCAQFKESVSNFTSAFADGHVSCLLVNFYLGNDYLPRHQIYVPETTSVGQQSPSSSSENEDEDVAGWQALHGAHADKAAAASHKKGVTRNFELVHQVVEMLGNVPVMMSAEDVLEHGPDEKAVILFTAFLCQRLLEMSKEERAAMVIQRLWRQRELKKPGTARAHLHRWISAAAVVQRAARVWLLRRGLRQFAARRKRCIAAVIKLQAIRRGREDRLHFLQLQRAAVKIQAAYRGAMDRRRVFNDVIVPRMLAVGLQKKRAVERSRYQGRLLAAVVSIQALRKASVMRRQYQQLRTAAISIQTAARGYQARTRYQEHRCAAIVLQKYWRQRQALLLVNQMRAAITVQKYFKAHLARKMLTTHREAAISIQASWRACAQRQQYQQQRKAAIFLQAAIRAWTARRSYTKLRQSATSIQACWRGHAERRGMKQQHQAATCIQAAWRRHWQQQQYLQIRATAVYLQSMVRSKMAVQQLLAARKAAIIIQQHARGFVARRHFWEKQIAATKLQSWWRCVTAYQRYRQQQQAAVCLQAAFRRMQAASRYQKVKRAAVHLQSAWRGRQARLAVKRQRGALAIQRYWRGHAVRRQVKQQQAAAVKLQAAWRSFAAYCLFQKQKQAAVLLQAAVRMQQSRRGLIQARFAATLVQAAWRGYMARQLVRRLRAAVVFQRAWRGRQARILLRQQRAAVVIQRVWRGCIVRKALFEQTMAAERLQAAWRRHAARSAYLKQRQAAIKIQAAARMHAARKLLSQHLSAAVAVQAAWRGFATRRWLTQTAAAVQVQRHVRGYLVRKRQEKQLAAALIIQRCFRQHIEWKRKRAIDDITRQMRELANTMIQYQQRLAAAKKLQAAWRGCVARKMFAVMLSEHREKLCIQHEREAAARGVIAGWAAVFRDRTWFLRARSATRVLQHWWKAQYARRSKAAIKVQAAARGFLARRLLSRSRSSAILIQAVWRGHHLRRSHPETKRLAVIRKRLCVAHRNAAGMAHMSLAARTRVALQGLLSCAHLGAATPSLEILAPCLEASSYCSAIVTEAGGTAVLLHLVQTASIRDQSCQEALRLALQSLAHVCRYQENAEGVFGHEGLLVLLADLLQHSRDKEDLFLAGTLLLQRLVADAERAMAMSRMPEILSKYEGVARMLALRLSQEHKYLLKLEGQKGSDASARQSTRALVSMTRQLTALQQVLTATGVPPLLQPTAAAPASPTDEGVTLGRNMIVRRTLRELQTGR